MTLDVIKIGSLEELGGTTYKRGSIIPNLPNNLTLLSNADILRADRLFTQDTVNDFGKSAYARLNSYIEKNKDTLYYQFTLHQTTNGRLAAIKAFALQRMANGPNAGKAAELFSRVVFELQRRS